MHIKKSIVAIMLMCSLLSGCGKQSFEEDAHLISMNEVRDQLADTMKKAKEGKYDKLSFGKIDPIVTSENRLTDIYEVSYQAGTEEKTVEACLKEQYQWICEIEGQQVPKKDVYDNKSDLWLDEIEQLVKKGKYPKELNSDIGYVMPSLSYRTYDADGNNDQLVSVDSGKCFINVILGNVASEELEKVDQYYANVTDQSLDDSYQLEDGGCTIREAIKWAETYENEGKPYSPGKDIRICASTVQVYKRSNGTYAYKIGMRRTYKGVTFQSAYQGSSVSNTNFDYDMCEIFMVNQTTPDYFVGMGANEKISEEGNTYEKIISLDRAFTLLNENMGENADCEVISAELSYCMKPEEESISKKYGYTQACHGTLAWKVEVFNKRDEKNIVFYIGATDYEGTNIESVILG